VFAHYHALFPSYSLGESAFCFVIPTHSSSNTHATASVPSKPQLAHCYRRRIRYMGPALEARKIKMRLLFLRIIVLATTTFVYASHKIRDSCDKGLTPCTPEGATSENTPEIGTPDFESLYMDIIASRLPGISKRSPNSDTAPLCCQESASCLLMANLKLPFCYDPFTTNYYLADNSFGTIVCISFLDLQSKIS
jgi:hypothetical protein